MESEVFSMKKEYEKKKKLVIFILAAVAVCLMGGLCFYLMKIGTPAEPEKDFVQQETEHTEVIVPEIDITKETDSLEEKGTEEPESSEQETEQPESSEIEPTDIHTRGEQGGDDSGKSQTKEDAQPPAEKPEIKDTDATDNPEQPPQYEPEVTEPEQKPEEPAGGSTNDSGQVFVPGYGYVDQPGAPQGESAGSDGDWNKQIGDMN